MKIISRTVAMALVAAAGMLTAPRPASACETDSPRPGVEIDLDDARPVTEGGVLMVRVVAYRIDVEAALQELLVWEVRRDGELQAGKFEVTPLWDGAATSVEGELHVFALIWRPDAPFTAGGEYTVDYQLARYEEMLRSVVTVVPATPAPVAEVVAAPSTVLVGGSEVVCCETLLSSCGQDSQCEPTHGTVLPAIDVEVDLSYDASAQFIVWVARALPGGDPGPHLQGEFGLRASPMVWQGSVSFDAPAEQYCVVVGLTDVRDGSETVAETFCVGDAVLGGPVERDVALSDRMQPYDEATPGSGHCVGPLVYEADGAAYPREDVPPAPSHGCSVAPPGGSLALLLLAFIRRRRARA